MSRVPGNVDLDTNAGGRDIRSTSINLLLKSASRFKPTIMGPSGCLVNILVLCGHS